MNDLELALFPDEQGGLTLELLANAQRYAAETLQRHASRFALLLSQLAAQPQRALGELDLLTPAEQQQIAAINDTGRCAAVHHAGGSGGGAGEQNAGRTRAGGCAASAELSPDARAGGRAGKPAARARREAGRQRGGGAAALGVPDAGAARHC